MIRMLGALVVAMGLGAWACPPGSVSSAKANCPPLVLQDTTQFVAKGDTLMMTTKSDTIPKPHATCVTLYATTKDTVPIP